MQVAVVFAKVARIDYPRQWQSVFADLISLIQNGSTLTVRRVYLVLHHILKELSSKRLTSDQKNFADVRDVLLCRSCLVMCPSLLTIPCIMLLPTIAAIVC